MLLERELAESKGTYVASKLRVTGTRSQRYAKNLKNNSQASSVLLEMAGRIEGTSFASKLRVAGTRSQQCTVEKLEE